VCDRRATVGILRLAVGPSDIPRLVVAIVVDAVNGVALRTLSTVPQHVFGKRLVVLAPFLANGDASSTIVTVCPMLRIVAPLLNSQPRSVQIPPVRIYSITVLPVGYARLLLLQAPTALCETPKEILGIHDPGLATVAAT